MQARRTAGYYFWRLEAFGARRRQAAPGVDGSHGPFLHYLAGLVLWIARDREGDCVHQLQHDLCFEDLLLCPSQVVRSAGLCGSGLAYSPTAGRAVMHIHSTAAVVAAAQQTGVSKLEGADDVHLAAAWACSVVNWSVDICSADTATVAAAVEVSVTVMVECFGSAAAIFADIRFVLVAGAAVTRSAETLFEVARELFDR